MVFIDAVHLVDLWLLRLDLEARITSIYILGFDLLYFFFNQIFCGDVEGHGVIHRFDF